MNENEKFENLNSVEQEAKLREVMEQIRVLLQVQIISGEVEIVDIAFSRLSNNNPSYAVTVKNNDNSISHLYYEESNGTLQMIDTEKKEQEINVLKKQISIYQMSGMDLTQFEEQLANDEQYIESVYSIDRISLSNLELARKETTDLALRLGLRPEDIEAYLRIDGNSSLDLSNMSEEELKKMQETIAASGMSEKEAMDNLKVTNGKASIDSKAFEGSGIQSSSIAGNDKVTTNYTFNQIMGLDYASYRIIKANNGVPMIIGVNKDGSAEIVHNNRLEINQSENRTMSLMRDDGTIKEVGVLVSFKIKDSTSSISRDQAIGLYSDNGTINGFYARNANGDRMIGEELPSTTYTTTRVHNERLMDTRYNQDISSEADSAKNRTDDGCIDEVRNLGNGQSDNMYNQKDADELAEEYADYYKLDVDKLKERFDDALEDNHSENTTDEKLMKQIAEEMDKEDRHEPDEPSLEPTNGPE